MQNNQSNSFVLLFAAGDLCEPRQEIFAYKATHAKNYDSNLILLSYIKHS